jgi:hypothetical protein
VAAVSAEDVVASPHELAVEEAVVLHADEPEFAATMPEVVPQGHAAATESVEAAITNIEHSSEHVETADAAPLSALHTTEDALPAHSNLEHEVPLTPDNQINPA